jgi:hypothetical protein
VGGWWSPTACRLHLTLAIAFPGCLAAGWFELTRALGGREIAWVYAGEWPLYGLCGIYIWWRLLHADDAKNAAIAGPDEASPSVLDSGGFHDDVTAEQLDQLRFSVDPELAAWEDYLKKLHQLDPPGGPPARGQ